MRTKILLGRGYVGNYYCQINSDCLFTNRKQTHFPNSFVFDLFVKETWRNLPVATEVIWTFPSSQIKEDINIAKEFYHFYCANKKTIILSTTSAYLNTVQGEIITENSNLDFTNCRVECEEILRTQGACILHLSGIMGPDRLPLKWYQTQRIKSGNQFINLIHVDDIVKCIDAVLDNFKPAERYNVSNGYYKKHEDIVEELKKQSLLDPHFFLPNESYASLGKRISNQKIRNEILPKNYIFMDYP
ncbi:hypothetical protein [Silvanigrella aquatica]|uniref:NAD-dependent epimerase/dehydratase domain-containing protein n=1 Tax=Silvanigrella aquatica TaxID=1915309 RepID=A0A1L4D0G8_9BACT|nr:hypothetical protein [Silvanigrella aquatica]APJ03695.1 hypothetical protein AXG55_07160 [Silvanigrella aquatica]